MGTADSQFLLNESDGPSWNVYSFPCVDWDLQGWAGAYLFWSSWSSGQGRPSVNMCAGTRLTSVLMEGRYSGWLFKRQQIWIGREEGRENFRGAE